MVLDSMRAAVLFFKCQLARPGLINGAKWKFWAKIIF